MTLLDDDAHDTVTVWPEVASTDVDGNPVRVPSATSVTVRCRVRPAAATEDGTDLDTRYRVIARDWPAGAASRVEWGGRLWDVEGEPVRRHGSEQTRHVTVTLRARGPEPLT